METGKTRFFLAVVSMVVFLAVPALTQDNQRLTTDETLEDLYRNGNHSVITLSKTYEGVKGTPFLVDEWTPP